MTLDSTKYATLGLQVMKIGLRSGATAMTIASDAFNVVVLLVLSEWRGAVGAAMAVVTTELLVTAAMALVLKQRNVPIFRVPATS